MVEYVRLSSPGRGHCSTTQKDWAIAQRTWRCPGCGAPKLGFGPINIEIEEDWPEDEPITFVNGSSLGLIRQDLLQALGPANVARELVLGHVSTEAGVALDEWRTVYGRHPIIVRGTKHVSFRTCEVCGRTHYFAMGTKYLYPEPASDVAIFDGGLGRLVVRETLLSSLDLSRWPTLRLERLKVFQKPKDGLGDLP